MQNTAFPSAWIRIPYGLYAWCIVLLVVIPVVLLLALTPGLLRRRALARWGANAIFVLIGSPIRLEGARIRAQEHCVVVANHASYLDGVILTAALPTHFTFLIKAEMSQLPVVGFILQRLGSQFVDRENASQRLRIGRRLVEAASQGDALAVFPEGTFDAKPGLKRFQGGAFRAARRAEVEVYPTVISGARRKFPAGRALINPGPLTVHICEPVQAAAFESPDALIRATRAAILAQLGEPDLDAAPATSPRSSDPLPLPEGASEYSGRGP